VGAVSVSTENDRHLFPVSAGMNVLVFILAIALIDISIDKVIVIMILSNA
jgi:hypothetical protein